jgi:hypothetical protein
MSIGTVMSQISLAAYRRLPVGRSATAAGRKDPPRGTSERFRSFPTAILGQGEGAVNAGKESDGAPPPVISAPPERALERKLKRKPGDPDAKADVGSDESMDASDPSSVTNPGGDDEPAPSSGFPE